MTGMLSHFIFKTVIIFVTRMAPTTMECFTWTNGWVTTPDDSVPLPAARWVRSILCLSESHPLRGVSPLAKLMHPEAFQLLGLLKALFPSQACNFCQSHWMGWEWFKGTAARRPHPLLSFDSQPLGLSLTLAPQGEFFFKGPALFLCY